MSFVFQLCFQLLQVEMVGAQQRHGRAVRLAHHGQHEMLWFHMVTMQADRFFLPEMEYFSNLG